MPSYNEDKDRLVLPRWRSFQSTLKTHELSPLIRLIEQPQMNITTFNKLKQDWRTHHTFSFAADLVSCAIVLGLELEVQDAAKFILSDRRQGFKAVKRIARQALGEKESEIVEARSDREVIHRLRNRLRDEPRNTLLWVDLARFYLIKGTYKKAEDSMRVAFNLAPENRFVLRSASRLYLHLNQPDKEEYGRIAHDILRKSDRVKRDPWILAAEIAVASVAKRTSRNIKHAKAILESRAFNPFQLSELASAVGTLELESGKIKQAKKIIRIAIEDPSENAAAQLAWFGRKSKDLQIDEELTNIRETSNEAQSWFYYYTSDWKNAELKARKWLIDQPFSSWPAIFDSFILSGILEEYKESMDVAKQGLIASPDNFTLLNNYAFAAVNAGEIENAKKYFRRIKYLKLNKKEQIIWHATHGLLFFREGDFVNGRFEYRRAIEKALRSGDDRLEARANLYFALEELRASTPEAENYRNEALSISARLINQYPDIKLLRERLSKYTRLS